MRIIKMIPVLAMIGLLAGCGQETEVYLDSTQQDFVQETESTGASDTEISDTETVGSENASILVYVCGEVNAPGVYELESGMRIGDAVSAAGGFTKAAGQEYWNLAEPLKDGQMLCIPTEEEARERKESYEETMESVSDGRININTADADKLTEIPGIGQTRAQAIIAYRTENGDFTCVEDIMKVSGIKNALFEKMKDFITVG
ncbi:MAG: helix-hairpin-helix domain-containing protein [Lachnospiraceae bacterium]|nr:helix-hairpin-helix domain-containing protein [Lachnospiraceae bacterium]